MLMFVIQEECYNKCSVIYTAADGSEPSKRRKRALHKPAARLHNGGPKRKKIFRKLGTYKRPKPTKIAKRKVKKHAAKPHSRAKPKKMNRKRPNTIPRLHKGAKTKKIIRKKVWKVWTYSHICIHIHTYIPIACTLIPS